MSPIIELREVNKVYNVAGSFGKKKQAHILKDVSFDIEEGTTLGLVGESGSGKTTTTRMVLRQENLTSGQLFYKGKDITKLSKDEDKKYRNEVQIVFQNPYSSLDPRMKVYDIIAEPLVIAGEHSKEEITKKVKKIMEEVGLAEDYLGRYPDEFSGGQRQRIAIARALVSRPELIILDEPVSALDVSIRGQIMNLLKSVQQSRKTTYLFISHDMTSVGFLSDKIAVMYFGYIVEYGDTETILDKYSHPYTEMLIKSNQTTALDDEEDLNIVDAPSHISPPKGCPFAGRCKYATDACRGEVPKLKEVEKGHYVSCHRYGEIDIDRNDQKIRKSKTPEYQI